MNKIDFLQGFLRSPLEVGSIIPSSRFMVNKIADQVRNENPRTIVELGAGTGVFTREICSLCNENTSFIVFEKDDKMREELGQQFHTPIYDDVLYLHEILDNMNINQVDCIVSGLPFTLFPKEKTEEILDKVYTRLRPGGCFIMYQYTPYLKQRLIRLFNEVSTKYVLLNIPPTVIYICRK